MNYWLVNSEPSVYSYDQLVKDKATTWDGVRSYAARNHLRSMQKGDIVLFYHSMDATEIAGIAKVSKEHFQDPTTEEEAWLAVELKPFKKLKTNITLAEIKAQPKLKNMPLVRIPRLSVMPVTEDEFTIIINLSGTKI